MSKLVIIFFLLVTAAASASAGDGAIVLANVNANLPLQKKITALPPVVTEKLDYYDVRGNSEKDLSAQMKQKGISWGDGKKYAAVTTWQVKWDYGYDRAPQTCSPESFLVTVEIVFHYPHWIRTEDAPLPLTGKWESYIQNLIAHEQGHGNMVAGAAKELSDAVAAMPPAPTCDELDRKIRTLCRTRMSRLNDEENRYDVATNHGRTQGVIFP